MRRIIVLVVLFMGMAAAFAEDKPKPGAKKPPTLSAEQKYAFVHAQSLLLQAQKAVDATKEGQNLIQKTAVFQQIINDDVAFCGQEFQFMLIKDGVPSNDGDPTCVTKPAETPAKAPETPKK